MKRYIALLTLALILIGVVWGGCVFDKAWYQLEEGDCTNDPLPEDAGLETVDTVSCSDAYEWRVVSTFEVPRQQSYPGVAFYDRMAWEQCDSRYTDFLFPLEEDWEEGNQIRTVICLQNSFGLSIRDPGRLDRLVALESLKINDCYKEAPRTDYSLVEKVNCSAQWEYKVTHIFEIDDLDSYPSDAYLDRLALRRCPQPWTHHYSPSPQSWRVGERTVQCLTSSSQ